MKAYKMFRVSKKNPGKLYPMFVLTDRETVMGKWLPAQMGKKNRDGKVMSRLGPLAFRPGWHLSDLPIAIHIGIKENGVIKYQRPDTVWCECEYTDKIDYQSQADHNGMNKAGVLIKKNAYLEYIPFDGFYRYKTSPVMLGDWIIAGGIKVNKVLTDAQVDQILRDNGMDPMPRYGGPIDLAAYGFEG